MRIGIIAGAIEMDAFTRVVMKALIALFLTSCLHAQDSSTNTFTSSSELVLIPAIVNDKSGSHISGLKKEDFALKLDGKSRPIAVFEEVKTSSALLHRSQGGQNTFTNV